MGDDSFVADAPILGTEDLTAEINESQGGVREVKGSKAWMMKGHLVRAYCHGTCRRPHLSHPLDRDHILPADAASVSARIT